MEKHVVEKVIEKIGQKLQSTGKAVQFSDKGYKTVEFDSKNFRKIEDKEHNCRIAFIDGGNNSVLNASNFCLQIARVYSTVYSGNKREKSRKKEFFLFASSTAREGKHFIDIEAFGEDIKFDSFSAFDSSLATGSHRASPSAAAAACRKLAELREAGALAGELEKGDVIVLDRDLQASITGEKEALEELYMKAEAKGVVVCGISKTTRLFTDTGDSAAAAVSAIAPEGDWIVPVAEAENMNHRAGIFFAKLHPKSKYVFRVEVYRKQKEEIGKIAAMLKKNSADPVFLGYPYGLIEADQFARASNEEAEYLKVRLMSKAGKESGRILEYMKTLDAHSVLDNIR